MGTFADNLALFAMEENIEVYPYSYVSFNRRYDERPLACALGLAALMNDTGILSRLREEERGESLNTTFSEALHASRLSKSFAYGLEGAYMGRIDTLDDGTILSERIAEYIENYAESGFDCVESEFRAGATEGFAFAKLVEDLELGR